MANLSKQILKTWQTFQGKEVKENMIIQQSHLLINSTINLLVTSIEVIEHQNLIKHQMLYVKHKLKNQKSLLFNLKYKSFILKQASNNHSWLIHQFTFVKHKSSKGSMTFHQASNKQSLMITKWEKTIELSAWQKLYMMWRRIRHIIRTVWSI